MMSTNDSKESGCVDVPEIQSPLTCNLMIRKSSAALSEMEGHVLGYFCSSLLVSSLCTLRLVRRLSTQGISHHNTDLMDVPPDITDVVSPRPQESVFYRADISSLQFLSLIGSTSSNSSTTLSRACASGSLMLPRGRFPDRSNSFVTVTKVTFLIPLTASN